MLDIAAGNQALKMSQNATVRGFAQEMVRDHKAVNDKALALVKKLHVTPEANPTSAALTKAADAERAKLAKLTGAAFDREYINNEVAYHKTVNAALERRSFHPRTMPSSSRCSRPASSSSRNTRRMPSRSR